MPKLGESAGTKYTFKPFFLLLKMTLYLRIREGQKICNIECLQRMRDRAITINTCTCCYSDLNYLISNFSNYTSYIPGYTLK